MGVQETLLVDDSAAPNPLENRGVIPITVREDNKSLVHIQVLPKKGLGGRLILGVKGVFSNGDACPIILLQIPKPCNPSVDIICIY